MWQFHVQICEAFSANRYPFPEEPSRQRQMNAEVTARLRELQTTIEAGAPPPDTTCHTSVPPELMTSDLVHERPH